MGVKYLCFVIEDIDGSTIFVPVESVSYFQRGEPAEVMASRTTFEL